MYSEHSAEPVSCRSLSLFPVQGLGFKAVKLFRNLSEMSIGAAPESPITVMAGSQRVFTWHLSLKALMPLTV